jgi:hypothetical protein
MNELKPIRNSPSCRSIEVGIFVGVCSELPRPGNLSLIGDESSMYRYQSEIRARASSRRNSLQKAEDAERLFNSKSKRE